MSISIDELARKLADDILSVLPVNPAEPVKVPGFRGAAHRRKLEAAGAIEVDETAWTQISEALGES